MRRDDKTILGLAARPVERPHERRAEVLAVRMLVDERLQLGDEPGVAAECQVGVHAPLQSGQPDLLEAADLRLRKRLVLQVGQRQPAPQAKRVPEESRSALGRGAFRRLDQLLEAQQVELIRRDSHDVARLTGLDHVGPPEHLAKLCHVVLQRVLDLARRTLTPEGVDQTVDRHHPVRTRQQKRQERPLQRSAELDDLPVPDHLERPKDPKLAAL